MSNQQPSMSSPSDPTVRFEAPIGSDPPPGRPPSRPGPPSGGPPWYVGAVGVLLLVIVGLLVFLVLRDDGEAIDTSGPTTSPTLPTTVSTALSSTGTTTSTSVSTSTTDATTTSASTTTTVQTTTTVDPDTYRSAVWPWFDSSTRYDDPVDAARAFAEEVVGFDDPIVGDFQQGDSRSGEVEVRPRQDGPVTVVLVRQLGTDDTWWVLGAATANIVLDEPSALDTITSPVDVSGRALAFEGTVELELLVDGSLTPIADGFVTGGGDELAPFDGVLSFDRPSESAGALLLRTSSAENGQVWEAAVIRVGFTD